MMIKMNQKGFTLVEIMIVVAIIGLLAAIAIPNLLRARTNANEGAMKTAMRTFSSANESYRAAQATPEYAQAITDLTGTTPPYIDTTWTSGSKHGFDLTYAAATAPANSYSFLAAPGANSGLTNTYCVDHTGVVVAGASGVSGDGTGCSGGSPLGG